MSSAESEMSQEPSPAPPPTKDEETSPKPDLKMGKSFITIDTFLPKVNGDRKVPSYLVLG